MRRRIHLIAPAGSCRPFFQQTGFSDAAAWKSHVQHIVGPEYLVTGEESLLSACEDENHGGRDDDLARARDIEQSLADSQVAAVVAVRGGAWFARILSRIDFSVLDRRTTPVAVFGFSELTPLVNIAGYRERGIGLYDMGPAFLPYGLKRFATERIESNTTPNTTQEMNPQDWAHAQLMPQLKAFFDDVVSMIEGRGSSRSLTATLHRGHLPVPCEARFVGGNLTVLSTLVGSAYDACVRPVGKWLLLEDFNDRLERFDRFLAHLTLSGYWTGCEGILLGDFHHGGVNMTDAVLELLDRHLPPSRPLPILVTPQIGHVWPMVPLPLHTPIQIMQNRSGMVSLRWNPHLLKCV